MSYSSASYTKSEEDILKTYRFEDLSDRCKNDFIEWFIGKDGVSEDIVQARRQAVQAYPTLAFEIYNVKEIREIVEQKKPLAPALAKYYKVDEKKLKRLQGKTIHDIGYITWLKINNILGMREEHFQELKNNLADLNILEDYGYKVYSLLFHRFLDTLSLRGGNLSQYIEKMKEHSVDDVRDAFIFLETRLFIPALLNRIKTHAEKNNLIFCNSSEWRVNRKEIIKHTSFKTILDFSERYHRNLFRWEDMFTFDSEMKHISWNPMFGEIDLRSGWEAREICSVASLKEQGKRENHCVGGYAGSILERDDDSARLIFSLEKNGEIKSTIDMICTKDKDRLHVKIKQNRAHSNKDPSSEVLKYSDLFINKIKAESGSRLDTYLNRLNDAREEYQKYQTDNKYVAECGYNPWDRDILEDVWDEFKPILPKRLRSLGLDGLINMMSIDDKDFRPRKKGDPLNPWDEIKNKAPI